MLIRALGTFFVGGLAVLLAACNPMATLDEGGTAVEEFHARFDASEFDAIWRASTPELRRTTTPDNFQTFMADLREKLGSVTSSERQGFNLNTNNGVTSVNLTMLTQFENGEGTEDFIFVRDGEVMQLHGYNVNSDALIKVAAE